VGFSGPVLVVFHGGTGEGAAERMMARARLAAAQHSARAALGGGFEAVIFATDSAAGVEPGPGLLVDTDAPGEPFAFFPRLCSIVRRYGLERPAVMGSGAVPLMGLQELRFAAEQLVARDRRFVTNNLFSGDLTGWTPGEAVFGLSGAARDNLLPRLLRDEAGLAPVLLPRTTASQFDLDTPADLAVLALREGLVDEVAAAIPVADLPLEPYRQVMRVVCDSTLELVVAGRVGSAAWQHLEHETACRVRLFSEERGLATAPPGHRARSVLGFLVEELGPERFFARVAELGDAVVVDTRVIEAHLGIEPSREDRFQSDLLNAEAIAEPWLRRFTAAARACGRPVLLGGHSLVSGGLMALADAAWRENDRLTGLV
jgi:hypothetical protein